MYDQAQNSLEISPKKVFICYRGSSEAAVSVGVELYCMLEHVEHIPCFFAPRVIPKGVDFKDKLPEYFQEVEVVVLLLTHGFFDPREDDVVKKELEVAMQNPRIRFFPIVFDGFHPGEYEKARDFLSSRQAVNRFRHKSAMTYSDTYDFNSAAAIRAVKNLVESSSVEQVRADLSDIEYDETEREFESSVTEFAVLYAKSRQCEEDLLQLVEEQQNDRLAYTAYYCLHALYRRLKNYEKIRQLVQSYHTHFSGHPTANHLLALYMTEIDNYGDDVDKFLEDIYQDAVKFQENVGYVHMFAFTFACVMECANVHGKDTLYQKWYFRARQAAEEAITMKSTYAKFYCTRGRILAINREFEQASEDIRKAISLEDSQRNDYSLRISDYQYYRAMTDTRRLLWESQQTRAKS